MKLGFSRVIRKLAKKRSTMSDGETIYYLDDDENVIGRLQNGNVLSLVVTGEDSCLKILTLVLSFKYKCDQGVVVADVAFVSDLNSDYLLPIVRKNRKVEFEPDEVFMSKTATLTSIGQVKQTETALDVRIPSLDVDNILREIISGNNHEFPIFHLTTRKLH